MSGNGLARQGQLPEVTITAATLRYLGYDPDNIATHALAALAKKYHLDPMLNEIQIIDTKRGRKVYITRDGLLAIAHRSGKLDGIVVDEERRSSDGKGYTAYVAVYRKDMRHPFRYGAQCKDNEPQAQSGNGPEMALTRAERRALKRAFQITDGFYPGQPDDGQDDEVHDYDGPDGPEFVGEGTPPQERQPVQPELAPSVERPLTDTPDIADYVAKPVPPGPGPVQFTDVSGISSSGAATPPGAAEFVVPTQDQWTEMRAQIQARGYRGQPAKRHAEFTRILGRDITDDNQLSRADCERVLAHWRTDSNGPF